MLKFDSQHPPAGPKRVSAHTTNLSIAFLTEAHVGRWLAAASSEYVGH